MVLFGADFFFGSCDGREVKFGNSKGLFVRQVLADGDGRDFAVPERSKGVTIFW